MTVKDCINVKPTRAAWLEIDLNNLRYNYRIIREKVGKNTMIQPTLKGNAYGHGAVVIGHILAEEGADRFGVATLPEAIELRESGIKIPIMIIGHTTPEEMPAAVQYDIIQTVSSLDWAKKIDQAAAKLGKKAVVHIKIDSGLGRIGFCPSPQAVEEIQAICALPHVDVEGVFSHFASADLKDKTFALQQFDTFMGFLDELEKAGVHFRIRHMANSAAVLDLPQTYLDLIRPGFNFTGRYPSADVRHDELLLRPTLSLKAIITYMKEVEPGTPVSYGSLWVAQRKSKIATVQLGYGDGYFRLYREKANALVCGKRVPICGAICMDQLMLDVTDVPDAAIGSEVVLLGRQGNDEITVEELSDSAQTIPQEVLISLNMRLERYFVQK